MPCTSEETTGRYNRASYQRAANGRSFGLHPQSIPISKRVKGGRAKRAPRRDYIPVLVESGLITVREQDAVDALRALNSIDVEDKLTSRFVVPSKPESLTDTVEKFVAFVGPSTNATVVEFFVPQIARELEAAESTLCFIVDVLLSIKAVSRCGSGAYIWEGTSTICSLLRESKGHLFDSSALSPDQSDSQLLKICIHYLDILRLQKEPMLIPFACEKLWKKINGEHMPPLDCLRLNQVIRCISSVFVGLDLIKDARNRTCLRYMLNPVFYEEQIAEEYNSSNNSDQINLLKLQKKLNDLGNKGSTEDSSVPPPLNNGLVGTNGGGVGNGHLLPNVDSWTLPSFSVPVKLDGNLDLMKIVQGASLLPHAKQRLDRKEDCQSNNRGAPLSGSRAPMQAAIMEIVGNEVSKMQIVDVIRHDPQPTSGERQHPGMNNGSEPLLAVALPEWMLQNQKPQMNLQPGHSHDQLQRMTPVIMQSTSPPQLFPQALLHRPNCVASWLNHQGISHTSFQPNGHQQLSGIQTPNQMSPYPSQFENLVEFLKDSFATQSRDFFILSDQDRVQQIPISRVKQF